MPMRLSAPGFRSVSHFVDLLRSANKSYDSKRAWRLLNLSWRTKATTGSYTPSMTNTPAPCWGRWE